MLTLPIIHFDEKGMMKNNIQDICYNYPFITLNERQLSDYEMIHNKSFHPLKGFMKYDEYKSVIEKMTLPDGSIWPIPINLHVSEEWIMKNIINGDIVRKKNLSLDDLILSNTFHLYLISQYTILKTETGIPLAVMNNESIYKMDLRLEADKVYDAITDNNIDYNHPYVSVLNSYEMNSLIYCIGGRFIYSSDVPRYDFLEIRKTPEQVKQEFVNRNWNLENYNIIAFQTRNPLHKSHFKLTKYALEEATKMNGKPSKLLLHPVIGNTQPGDVDYNIRVKCYQKLLEYYDENEVILSLLQLSMRMAGPREALWHAIIRKNYGVSHFVVGRDHAGPSTNRINSQKFYHPYDAQNLLLQYSDKIGLSIITSKSIVFCVNREKIEILWKKHFPDKELNDHDIKNLDFISILNETDGEFKSIDKIDSQNIPFEISGSQLRTILRNNLKIPDWYSFPSIINILKNYYQTKNGIVFYLIGLSGAGKSTIANILIDKIKELTYRKVSYLDGDIIRLNLSKGLGFSKEDRSTNVRRIGFVASEISKHGGICVVANIAPYEIDRKYNRNLIEKNEGKYIEIFVDTMIEECERRDIKGLYKLARQNKIQLTGVNDTFEIPSNPEIHVNGSDSINNIINKIMEYIKNNELLKY
jgi:sulfate adenylyltransferase